MGFMADANRNLGGVPEVDAVQEYIDRHREICLAEGESPTFSVERVATSLEQIATLTAVAEAVPDDCVLADHLGWEQEQLAIGATFMTVERFECTLTERDQQARQALLDEHDAWERANPLPPRLPRGIGDLDCADFSGSVTILGSDPHRLDADNDGIGCE